MQLPHLSLKTALSQKALSIKNIKPIFLKRRSIQSIFLLTSLTLLLMLINPLKATADMGDWYVTGDNENNTGNWVYYKNNDFPDIHFSRHVDNPSEDHMAIDNSRAYYYGHTNSFSPQTPANRQADLKSAWRNYYKAVREGGCRDAQGRNRC